MICSNSLEFFFGSCPRTNQDYTGYQDRVEVDKVEKALSFQVLLSVQVFFSPKTLRFS